MDKKVKMENEKMRIRGNINVEKTYVSISFHEVYTAVLAIFSNFLQNVNCPCLVWSRPLYKVIARQLVSPHYARRRILRVKLLSLYLNLKSRNHCRVILRMLPTQEILFVKDSDMKAMISPVSVGKIQSLLFHRHRNREGTTGGTCSPRFCNKERRIMYFICSYIFIFDLFREGCPSTEVDF